jgi:guanine deaminase
MTAFGIRATFVDFIEDPWRHVGRESEAARFHADGLLVVEDGRIADFGTHDEAPRGTQGWSSRPSATG